VELSAAAAAAAQFHRGVTHPRVPDHRQRALRGDEPLEVVAVEEEVLRNRAHACTKKQSDTREQLLTEQTKEKRFVI
jgi:hypothetical protein